ncbi:hypothetical protein [uncultured Roseibium sp.]|uniref:hypothetical protein n=1 Tax=uncultured Roseibium sp. TaxID=1936171 RepID=UPI003217C348
MSIQLQLRVTTGQPIYRGHDHYWSVIRDLGKAQALFTLAQIGERTNDPVNDCVIDYVRRLTKAGFLEVADRQRVPTNVGTTTVQQLYRLLKRPAATPRLNRDGTIAKQGLGQEQLWTAIRALSGFDSRELAIAATTDDVAIAVETAKAYARHLESAGYLQVLRPGSGTKSRIWRLKRSMDTGPKAPKILRSKMVYDTNRGEIMGAPVAEECAA